MKMKKILAFTAVGAMTALTPGLNADEAEVKADVDLRGTEARSELKKDDDSKFRADATLNTADKDKVRGSNKASGLLGMEVRNNDNEKLGEIKDLVMDLNSGKVSYAVLAVGGFLGIGEKLIALPPASLRISDDKAHLILNADKARIQAAPGFAATSWPSVNDPEINSFWKAEATGAPAGSEVRRDRDVDVDADVDVDRDRKKVRGELDLDKKDKIYTDAEEDKKVKVDVDKD